MIMLSQHEIYRAAGKHSNPYFSWTFLAMPSELGHLMVQHSKQPYHVSVRTSPCCMPLTQANESNSFVLGNVVSHTIL